MSSQAYIQERRAFEQIKKKCSGNVKKEYELAISTLVQRYNTTIHENRFVVGGAVEEFTWALLRSVDVECDLCGSQSPDGDIIFPNDELLSIKSSFRGVADIKLINQMGTGDRAWTTATLFVVSGVGIVYGAPDMVDSAHVKPTGDGVSLKRAGLQTLIDDQANVFEAEIASKPPKEMADQSLKASSAVARQILQDTNSEVLSDILSA